MTVQEIEDLIQKLITYRDTLSLQQKLGEEVDLTPALNKLKEEVLTKLTEVEGVADAIQTSKVSE